MVRSSSSLYQSHYSEGIYIYICILVYILSDKLLPVPVHINGDEGRMQRAPMHDDGIVKQELTSESIKIDIATSNNM